MARYGIFGGTFNPIHYGHLRMAEEVREALCLDGILFVPAGTPPLKAGDVAPAALRHRMVELAVAGNAAFEVLDIESARPGMSFTVDTVEALARLYPGDGLAFITGLDAFLALDQWRDAGRLVRMVDFIVVGRAGYGFEGLSGSPFLDLDAGALGGLGEPGRCVRAKLRGGDRRAEIVAATALDISATRIRGMVAAGGSLRYLLPPPVESFIISHGLYAGRRTGGPGGARRGCRVPEGG